MNVLFKALALVIALALFHRKAISQDSINLYDKNARFPDRLFKQVDGKTTDIHQKLVKQSVHYLEKLAKQEEKLKKKLAKKDSLAAARIFDHAQGQYAALQSRIKSAGNKATSIGNKYIPHLDTLKTAFNFLSKADGIVKNAPDVQSKFKDAVRKMDGLQDKFDQAEEIKKFIGQRKQYLQEQLTKFGMLKEFKAYKKQVYYYQAQVDEYKKMFDDPSKLEAKALAILQQTQAFRDFFSRYSQLAGMFRLPSSDNPSGSAASLAGLQTRASVQQDMMQRFGSIPDVEQLVQQQVQDAKSQLSALKEKLNSKGGSGNDLEMPNFKPNGQKTKSFTQRLELGYNMQTVKSNRFFPSTTDIGLSLGYKLNDKSIVGIGSSYKMGWGKDFRHISISHQGMGFRSFMDYKIKGSFWLSGGAEMNYRSQFKNFEILDDYSAWQKSALVGISKKYQVSKKIKGNAQVMYDALWKQQGLRTQPIVFRLGYNFLSKF